MKSSISKASQGGMIVSHEKLFRSVAADGTGYVAFERKLKNI